MDQDRPDKTGHRAHATRSRRWAPLLALTVAVSLALATFLSQGPAGALTPVASAHPAHAYLVRSDPAADAILRSPPSHVTLWFSERVTLGLSRAAVVDPANREADNRDSRVSSSDPRQMTLSVPLLPAGAYIVVWQTESADDGHVTGGSFIYRVARPDGTVPPVPSVLPTGHVPGAGGLLRQRAGTWMGQHCCRRRLPGSPYSS